MASFLDANQIIDARIKGDTIPVIAGRLACSIADVHDAIDNYARATLTTRLRTHSLAIDLARLDKLMKTYEKQAEAGDVQSAAIVLKIIERRQIMLGLAAPPRVDPNLLELQAKPVSSTERIREALDRLRELPAPEPKQDEN